MVKQIPVEFALNLTQKSLVELKYSSGKTFLALHSIRHYLVHALPEDSAERIRVSAIIADEDRVKDTPW